jgi:bifunctional DNA-binding transcriptional regulator/antitoxin component of YhaV-PrlF toxin-antitoxin module
MNYTLKLFNTGQVTLPKSWRDKYNTNNFLAIETQKWLLIQPIVSDLDDIFDVTESEIYEVWENNVAYYEDKKYWETGLHFINWITPKELIKKISDLKYGQNS